MDERANQDGRVTDDVNVSMGMVSAAQAVATLNRALQTDPRCVNSMFRVFVPCSVEMAMSEIEAIRAHSSYLTNFLGLLNAIFSYRDDDGEYRIVAVTDDSGVITEFRLGRINAPTDL